MPMNLKSGYKILFYAGMLVIALLIFTGKLERTFTPKLIGVYFIAGSILGLIFKVPLGSNSPWLNLDKHEYTKANNAENYFLLGLGVFVVVSGILFIK